MKQTKYQGPHSNLNHPAGKAAEAVARVEHSPIVHKGVTPKSLRKKSKRL